MAASFAISRLDLLLIDVVQRLGDEYPGVPYGVVARCVEAARHLRVPDVEDVATLVGRIEASARADVEQMLTSLAATVQP